MMVRMMVGLSGPTINLAPGDEHDCDQAEAIRWIEAGIAIPVVGEVVERAVKPVAAERRKKKAD
jgi:hypothetical protein